MLLGNGVSFWASRLVKINSYLNKGFYRNILARALVARLLFFVHIPRPKHQALVTLGIRNILNGLDYIGLLLFAPAAIIFLLAFEWGGNAYRWDSATGIRLFCGAAGAGIPSRRHCHDPVLNDEKKNYIYDLHYNVLSCRQPYDHELLYANLFSSSEGVSPLLAGVYILPSILSQVGIDIVIGVLNWYPDKLMARSR